MSEAAYGEEDAFRRTLESGTEIFDLAVAKAKESGSDAVSGEDAFKLHDTYGFPIEITLEMAADQASRSMRRSSASSWPSRRAVPVQMP